MTDRPSIYDLAREHAQPVEDLVECYRIALGDEVVDAALRESQQRVVADIFRDQRRGKRAGGAA